MSIRPSNARSLAADYTAAMVEESETPESASVVDLTESVAANQEPVDTVGHGVANTPDVDDLQARLADLQAAMDQLQSGDLDAAEAAIEQLEKAMAGTMSHGSGTANAAVTGTP